VLPVSFAPMRRRDYLSHGANRMTFSNVLMAGAGGGIASNRMIGPGSRDGIKAAFQGDACRKARNSTSIPVQSAN